MNREIKILGGVLVAMFTALFIQVNNLQVFSAKRLNEHPANSRAVVRDFSQPRGQIRTSDGVVIADSVPSDDEFKLQRRYPEGELFSHLTGFFSFTFGTDGLERTYNDALTGRDSQGLRLDRLDEFLSEQANTQDVVITVAKSVQQAAAEALGGRRGSVVALDPRSGAILAMVSFPSFNPATLADHDQKLVRKAWDALNADEARPLRPRAYRDLYFPGSSFKVVTAAAGLANGLTPVRPSFPVLKSLPLPQSSAPLGNFGGSSCGGNLSDALRVSCNTVFGQIGLDLGGPALANAAEGFGFNRVPPIDLPFAEASFFPEGKSFDRDRPALAKSAIGQQDVSSTPLQMALVAAGVANGGVIMAPHLLKEISRPQSGEVQAFTPKPWKTALSASNAADLTAMMVAVVERGSGTRARIPGVAVAGKTGTAQTGRDRSHAWFVAFAPAEAPRVAVAVVLEDVPSASDATGGALASPIAKIVMERALASPAS